MPRAGSADCSHPVPLNQREVTVYLQPRFFSSPSHSLKSCRCPRFSVYHGLRQRRRLRLVKHQTATVPRPRPSLAALPVLPSSCSYGSGCECPHCKGDPGRHQSPSCRTWCVLGVMIWVCCDLMLLLHFNKRCRQEFNRKASYDFQPVPETLS